MAILAYCHRNHTGTMPDAKSREERGLTESDL